MCKAVIFDIDGTLADNSDRQLILANNKYDWKNFLKNMGDDLPNKPIIELYNIIKDTKRYKLLIVSGRPDTYKTITEQWLCWNNIEYDALYMRSAKDERSDVDIKREILYKLKEKYNVVFVFDDRSSVVKMWRDEGLTCLQCYNHNY